MDIDTSVIEKDQMENLSAEIEKTIVILHLFSAIIFTSLSDVFNLMPTGTVHLYIDMNISQILKLCYITYCFTEWAYLNCFMFSYAKKGTIRNDRKKPNS